MALKTENITIDITDPEKLADWWARAVDGQVNPVAPPFFVAVTRPEGPGLAFQKVDDPTPARTACTSTSAPPTWRPRSSGWSNSAPAKPAGATSAISSWVVLADPDGNAFCVAGG